MPSKAPFCGWTFLLARQGGKDGKTTQEEEHGASANGYKCFSTRRHYRLCLDMKAPPLEELKLSYRKFSYCLGFPSQYLMGAVAAV